MISRKLSVVLFLAACGGGGDGPTIVDSPTGTDGGGNFPNSRNDVVHVTFPDQGSGLSLTPNTTDQPDNQASPLTITPGSAGFKIAGEFGIAGERGDEYFERDSYLITTDATTNQLTVRMAWDGGTSDQDMFIFEELPSGETEVFAVASGTRISNTDNEFQTFVVQPNTNYWLWGGVYQENAAPGGAPTLPAPYDFSIYGDAFVPANVGACTVTEAADATNNSIESLDGMGTREATNANPSGAPVVYCGNLNNNFVADPADPTIGTLDVDAFEMNLALESDMIVTITGVDANAQAALASPTLAVQYGIFNDANPGLTPPRPQQFYSIGDFVLSHGVLTARLPASNTADPMNAADIVGPKTLAIFAFSEAGALPANPIAYKVELKVDNPNVRGARIGGSATVTEANDL